MSLIVQRVGSDEWGRWLRQDTNRVIEMIEHFSEYRITPGSGIKGGSCSAVTLTGDLVYGNSQARYLDSRASELGEGHAELVAFELGENPRRIFCELSPCERCQRRLKAKLAGDGRELVLYYLFKYPEERTAWRDFHKKSCDDQIAFTLKRMGLVSSRSTV